MKIPKIIQKNLKLLMRSYSSIVTTLVGPLVVIILVGLAFGNITSYNINVGVYAPEYTELTDSFIDHLSNKSFKVTKYPLEDLCINDIKKGTVHTCIFFPDDFDVGGNKSSTIEFYVDETNVNVVSMVKEAVTKQVSSKMRELSEDLTENILGKIDDVKQTAQEQTEIVVELIDNSNQVSSDVESVRNDLDDMELDFNKNDLELDDIEDLADDVKTLLLSLHTDVDSLLDENISSEVENELEDLKARLNDTSTVDELMTTASNSSSKLTEISNNVNTADATKNSLRDELTGVRQDVTKFQEKLQDLEKTIQSMTGNVGDLSVTDAEGIVAPVKTLVKPVVAEKAPLHYMLPSLIVLIIMFISMLLAGTLVVMEKTSSAYFRNFVTPTKDSVFLYGTLFTNLIVVSLQMILVLGALFFVFNADFFSNISSVLIIILLSVGVFSIVGMIIGYLFSTQEMVSLGGITVGSLFLLMSNVIFPLEKMPNYLVRFSQYNPFIISESLLRKSMIFKTDIIYLISDIFLLFLIMVGLFILLVGVEKMGKRIFLTGVHFLKHKKYGSIDKEKLEELKAQQTMLNEEDDKDKKKGKGKTKEEPKKDAPAYTEMDVPKKKNWFTSLFKKTTRIFDESNILEKPVEEFDQKGDDKDSKKESKKGKGSSKSKSSKSSSRSKSPKKPEDKNSVKSLIKKMTSGEEETNPLLAKLEPHQYFVLSSGNIVKSYKELISMLQDMDDETFKYHVGKGKNDFYLWVKNVLKAEDVAAKIKDLKDRKTMIKALKRFL